MLIVDVNLTCRIMWQVLLMENIIVYEMVAMCI